MTPEQITARSRALQFFGPDDYWKMVQSAKDFLERSHYPIPPQGVESMPVFWEAISEIMTEAVQ